MCDSAGIPEWYEVCAYCQQPVDMSGAAIVLGTNEPSYVPFMEDWRGGFVQIAHPRCFAEQAGIDALLSAVARNDTRRR